MISQEEILERVLTRISGELASSIQTTITETVQRELSATMTKAMAESEFYRHLNDEMRSGLKGIYHEISSASGTDQAAGGHIDTGGTQQLFSDATKQIDEIMHTVFEATEEIFESAELMLAQQEEAGEIIANLEVTAKSEKQLAKLDELNQSLEGALTKVITSLSFQDLTGQRLKKLLTAITTIQETVFDLYVSTGLMLKHSNEVGEKGIEQVQEETRKTMEELKEKGSELKGPSRDASQQDVDDLLSSLGL